MIPMLTRLLIALYFIKFKYFLIFNLQLSSSYVVNRSYKINLNFIAANVMYISSLRVICLSATLPLNARIHDFYYRFSKVQKKSIYKFTRVCLTPSEK